MQIRHPGLAVSTSAALWAHDLAGRGQFVKGMVAAGMCRWTRHWRIAGLDG